MTDTQAHEHDWYPFYSNGDLKCRVCAAVHDKLNPNEHFALRAKNERLREALKFYANHNNWIDDEVTYEQIDDSTSVSISCYSHPTDRDHGATAREALKEPD